MAAVLGFAFLFQIVLLFRGSVATYECTYKDFYTGRTTTKFCSTSCCETDCCEGTALNSRGAIVGVMTVSVFVILFIITMVICRLVSGCPQARRRRALIVRRTIATTGVVPPENHFQNPLSHPPSAGSHHPNTALPSYDQAVTSTFTPLPTGSHHPNIPPPSYDKAAPLAFTPLPAVHPPQAAGCKAN